MRVLQGLINITAHICPYINPIVPTTRVGNNFSQSCVLYSDTYSRTRARSRDRRKRARTALRRMIRRGVCRVKCIDEQYFRKLRPRPGAKSISNTEASSATLRAVRVGTLTLDKESQIGFYPEGGEHLQQIVFPIFSGSLPKSRHRRQKVGRRPAHVAERWQESNWDRRPHRPSRGGQTDDAAGTERPVAVGRCSRIELK